MSSNLDNIDKRILFELYLNARIPETELAKKIKKSREVVRYRMAQLKDKGIIQSYYTMIDMSRLGYSGYKVYLKIGGKGSRRAEFIEHLKSQKDVFWLGVADGSWDIGLTMFARSAEEFYERKNKLLSSFCDIILERKIGILAKVQVHPLKLLFQGKAEPARIFSKPVENELDEIGRRMLGELFHDSRIRVMDLAGKLGCSAEMVRTRMKRFEEDGIISCYRIAIDYRKIGMEFYKTFLYFDDLNPAVAKRLDGFCREHPDILNVVWQISPWDVELEILVKDHSAYMKIMDQLRELFPNELRNIESAVLSEDVLFPAKRTVFD